MLFFVIRRVKPSNTTTHTCTKWVWTKGGEVRFSYFSLVCAGMGEKPWFTTIAGVVCTTLVGWLAGWLTGSPILNRTHAQHQCSTRMEMLFGRAEHTGSLTRERETRSAAHATLAYQQFTKKAVVLRAWYRIRYRTCVVLSND